MAQFDATLPAVSEDLGSARTMGVEEHSLAHAATAFSPASGAVPVSAAAPRSRSIDRTTVLPRIVGGAGVDSMKASAHGELPRYEPVQSLGEGGMGEVALVRDQDIGRQVAVKRLLPGLGYDALERFAREVRIVGKLEHPGIVPVHDVGIDGDGRHYFVMKYVEGETLESILDRLRASDPLYRTRFSPGRRVEIFHELLQALRYAHAHGVIHRDIKPSNVMIGAYGEVLLMDWGIAKEIGAAESASAQPAPAGPAAAAAASDPKAAFRTRHGSLIGTPAYMAPEQARGETTKLDQRCDTYALCVLFHEMLTLHHYLEDRRALEQLIFAIGSDEEPGFMELVAACSREGVGAELVHFLRKGLKKKPEERYQSVDEMIEVLDAIRDQRVKVQCHLTFARRVTGALARRANRHPNLATFAGLFALAVFAVGLVAMVSAALQLARG
jgi:serine/threonine-protein kinase